MLLITVQQGCSPLRVKAAPFGRRHCFSILPGHFRRAKGTLSNLGKDITPSHPRAIGLNARPLCLKEEEIEGMERFLNALKWNDDGLVAVIVQHVDTGEVLMQAFADRAAISETLQTRLATFFSRSRSARWCKGETSGHYIKVTGVYPDCDRDSLIYLGEPIGPACHTGAPSCWFSSVTLEQEKGVKELGEHTSRNHAPLTTLLALEHTIHQRRADLVKADGGRPSWTAKLLGDRELLCRKVREEAGELCQTLEASEGPERAASEAADLLYHALVLLAVQDVQVGDVLKVLRQRFGISGVEEKAAREAK